MTFRHSGRDNLAIVIDPNMQFLPAFALLLTVFLGIPFALTAYLQATISTIRERGLSGARSILRRMATVALRRDSIV